MALISCPECNREISDKVTSCPHCGYPFPSSDTSTDNNPIPVEVTSVKFGTPDPVKKKKRFGFIIGSLVAIVVVVAIAVFIQNQNNSNARNTYIENLYSVRSLMLTGGAEAETLCNLTRAVWYNTIFEEYDTETNPYTQNSYGGYHSDFNESLRVLYDDASTKETIAFIKQNQSEVDELMRSLQNPTEEFSACYDTLDSMYDAYKGLTGLAISPSGSLTSYTDEFSQYDNSFMDYYEKIETQIPES